MATINLSLLLGFVRDALPLTFFVFMVAIAAGMGYALAEPGALYPVATVASS